MGKLPQLSGGTVPEIDVGKRLMYLIASVRRRKHKKPSPITHADLVKEERRQARVSAKWHKKGRLK